MAEIEIGTKTKRGSLEIVPSAKPSPGELSGSWRSRDGLSGPSSFLFIQLGRVCPGRILRASPEAHQQIPLPWSPLRSPQPQLTFQAGRALGHLALPGKAKARYRCQSPRIKPLFDCCSLQSFVNVAVPISC